jgi:TolB-like protein/Flp pilus assembly protein TadD
MSKTSPVPEALSANSSESDHLDSWKEIAAYLKRDVRTLQRWEKRENLPVHRHRHDRLGSVYAYKSELGAWSLNRQLPPRPHAVAGLKIESGKIRLLVLPFENLSGDPEQGYFSDGLTEEMITQLGRLEPQRLGIIGRTTAMQYKGSSKRIDQIGRELRVDYVLEGSTRRYADRVRIAAQLVRANDQTHLWAETYDRDVRDVLALQSDVAQSIAREIRLALPAREQARLAGIRRPVNPEAYEAYLKGRCLWYERNTQALTRSVEYFQQAIQKEPNYALAYAGLADAYGLLALIPWDGLPPREAMPKAMAAAKKALEIDESLAEAYSSLAMVLHRYDWDWRGSEQNYRRAIELNPNNARAHLWYAWLLMALDRRQEALDEIKEAEEVTRKIDPFALVDIRATMAESLYLARQYDRAIAECRGGLQLNPDYFLLHFVLGRCYVLKRMHASAIRVFERAVRSAKDNLLLVTSLIHTYAVSGRRAKALKSLEEFKKTSKWRYVPAMYFACIYAGLLDKDQAFFWLEKAYQERSDGMTYLNVEPTFDPLRSDPRFQDLLHRVGLSPQTH